MTVLHELVPIPYDSEYKLESTETVYNTLTFNPNPDDSLTGSVTFDHMYAERTYPGFKDKNIVHFVADGVYTFNPHDEVSGEFRIEGMTWKIICDDTEVTIDDVDVSPSELFNDMINTTEYKTSYKQIADDRYIDYYGDPGINSMPRSDAIFKVEYMIYFEDVLPFNDECYGIEEDELTDTYVVLKDKCTLSHKRQFLSNIPYDAYEEKYLSFTHDIYINDIIDKYKEMCDHKNEEVSNEFIDAINLDDSFSVVKLFTPTREILTWHILTHTFSEKEMKIRGRKVIRKIPTETIYHTSIHHHHDIEMNLHPGDVEMRDMMISVCPNITYEKNDEIISRVLNL